MIEKCDDPQHRKRNAFDWSDRVRRVQNLNPYVYRRVVHVVFDSFSIDNLKASDIVLPELYVRAYRCSPTDVVSAKVKLIINYIYPSYAPDNSGNLNVPPIAIESHVSRQIRQVEPWSDAL